MNYKFTTLENRDATKVLKQHAYIEAKRTGKYGEKYNGNRQLCNKNGGAHDGDSFVDFSFIYSETINNDKICKKCLKLINGL